MSFGVTSNPTAEWISRQITEAFPWDHAPEYLIRDRDRSYGSVFVRRLSAMGIRDRPIAPRSPWQNAYVERLIGTIRRECLDHIIVFGETHLRRIVGVYAAYYNETRTHRSLDKDAPFHRAIQRLGAITSQPVDFITNIAESDFWYTQPAARCRNRRRGSFMGFPLNAGDELTHSAMMLY
jgi:transposase InsO family protein